VLEVLMRPHLLGYYMLNRQGSERESGLQIRLEASDQAVPIVLSEPI